MKEKKAQSHTSGKYHTAQIFTPNDCQTAHRNINKNRASWPRVLLLLFLNAVSIIKVNNNKKNDTIDWKHITSVMTYKYFIKKKKAMGSYRTVASWGTKWHYETGWAGACWLTLKFWMFFTILAISHKLHLLRRNYMCLVDCSTTVWQFSQNWLTPNKQLANFVKD